VIPDYGRAVNSVVLDPGGLKEGSVDVRAERGEEANVLGDTLGGNR